MNSSDHACNESDQSILEEIEVLKAILFSELDVTYSPSGRPLELQTILYPSTADEAKQQYVCLTLFMKFPPDYPDQPPAIKLKNPRGLGEDFLANALKLCHEKCDHFSGSPVIYEIIELLRECLTNSNRPTGHCTICLFDFHLEDVFTYTPCYHHFHSHCLSRFCESLISQWKEEENQEAIINPSGSNWKEKKVKQFTCPVCREIINVELATLKEAPPPREGENFQEDFLRDAKFNTWRREMEEEYQRQKIRGGIIDREIEDSRFLVVTENVSETLSTELSSLPSAEDEVQQNQQQPLPVQATATSKAAVASSKSDCYRGQARPPRGKWIRRSETNSKERPASAHNVPRLSNPSHRQTERSDSQPRHRTDGPPHPTGARANGTEPLPAQMRPPPGFAPRQVPRPPLYLL